MADTYTLSPHRTGSSARPTARPSSTSWPRPKAGRPLFRVYSQSSACPLVWTAEEETSGFGSLNGHLGTLSPTAYPEALSSDSPIRKASKTRPADRGGMLATLIHSSTLVYVHLSQVRALAKRSSIGPSRLQSHSSFTTCPKSSRHGYEAGATPTPLFASTGAPTPTPIVHTVMHQVSHIKAVAADIRRNAWRRACAATCKQPGG